MEHPTWNEEHVVILGSIISMSSINEDDHQTRAIIIDRSSSLGTPLAHRAILTIARTLMSSVSNPVEAISFIIV